MPSDHEIVDLTDSSLAEPPQQTSQGLTPSSEDYNCPICLELLLEPVVGACGHEFCRDCYAQWLSRSRSYPSCPLCRVPLSMTIPGVSRRLADLIEASFPAKVKRRREMHDKDKQAEAARLPASGNLPPDVSSSGAPDTARSYIASELPHLLRMFNTHSAPETLLGHLSMPHNGAGNTARQGHRPAETGQGPIQHHDMMPEWRHANDTTFAPSFQPAQLSHANIDFLHQELNNGPHPPFFPVSLSDYEESDYEESDYEEDIEDESVYASSGDVHDVPTDAVDTLNADASNPPASSPPEIPVEDVQLSPFHSVRYRRPDSPYPFQEIAAAQQQYDPHALTASWAPPQTLQPLQHITQSEREARVRQHWTEVFRSRQEFLQQANPGSATDLPLPAQSQDFSRLLHSADRLAEASERLAVLAENQGQVSDQMRGLASAEAGPRATFTLRPSVWGQAPNIPYLSATHQYEDTAPSSDMHAGSHAVADFSNPAAVSNRFAQGLPSPSRMPFTMGVDRREPDGGSRLRRARQVAAASVNPPRFRNRMQQRRARFINLQ